MALPNEPPKQLKKDKREERKLVRWRKVFKKIRKEYVAVKSWNQKELNEEGGKKELSF